MSNIHHDMTPALDYSLEAKKLWSRLGKVSSVTINISSYFHLHPGINPEDINKDKRGFNPLDIIYKSPEGGCVYVGEQIFWIQLMRCRFSQFSVQEAKELLETWSS